MKFNIKHTPVFFFMILMWACASDRGEGPVGPIDGSLEVEFTASLKGQGSVLTRAMTYDQEYYVETVDVLVFEYDNAAEGGGTFLYAIHGVDIQNLPGGMDKKFKTSLATTLNGGTIDLAGKSIFLQVIANCRSEWNAVKGSVSAGDSFQSVVNRLVYDSQFAWNTSSPRYLPMAAAPTGVVTLSGSVKGADFGTLNFTRAVAALDIGFNYGTGVTPNGFGNFKLGQVVVRNSRDRGYVTGFHTRSGDVSYPRIPSPAQNVPEQTYYLPIPSATGLFNTVYLPESDMLWKSDAEPADLLNILIGGYYTAAGDTENTSDVSWYRIDLDGRIFVGSQTEPETFLRRNYKYTIKVDEISGSGFGSKEEAVAGAPNLWFNMNVVPWSESTHTPGIDGPYHFDVSQREFTFSFPAVTATSGNNVVELYTDYSGGWKVEGITYETDPGAYPWLSTDVGEGDPFQKGYLTIIAKANTGGERIGYINVSAGRWRYTVRVTQQKVRYS